MKIMSQNISRIGAALSVRSDLPVGAITVQRAERGFQPVRLPFLILALFCLYLLLAAAGIPALAQDTSPAAPTNLTASFTNDGVLLSWTAPAGDVDGYEILRRRPLQGENELTTLVDDTFSDNTVRMDTSATIGERYIYGVKTIRGADRSPLSSLVDFVYQQQDQQQNPSIPAPSNLSASISAGGVTLSWTAPSGTVDGYEILRRRPLQGENVPRTLVDNTGSSATTYTDASATTPGEQYIYWVKTIRGTDRSALSQQFAQVDFVTVSCQILAGANHDILQCAVDAGDRVITSTEWTPSYEVQYAQTKDGPVANWVIGAEYCGQTTTVSVDASEGDALLSSVETTITLACAPTPPDTLTVSCETLIVNSQHELHCALSGGDQTIDSALWTPSYDAQAAITTEGANATEASWVISAEQCGQTANVEVVPQSGDSTLPAVRTSISIPCVITVDGNCSLANAIRSAQGIAQVEESSDTDGNDECETGATGDDIILLTTNVTLASALPTISSAVHIEGGGHTLSGDDQYQVLNTNGGQLSISNLTIANGSSATEGGGVYVNSGSLRISDSHIMNSDAADVGGGIYAIDSDIDIVDTEVSGNTTVKSHGGGVYFISSTGLNTLDISGATFANNQATEDGGALKTAGGIANVDKSTFVENAADEGGAIESSQTTLDITNSTFSSNSAREGGGLSSFSSFVTLTHTTWAYNSAAEQGGGIAIIGWTGNFKIRNTLITDSASGGDCHSGPNPEIMLEFTGNFIQDGSCAPEPAESQAVASDEGAVIEAVAQHDDDDHDDPVVLVPAGITSLSGNPPHHPLLWGSPAIDNADPTYCSRDDQPQTARPQYGNCDIGAYEYPRAPEPTPTPRPPVVNEPDDDEPDSPPAATPPPPISYICIENDRIVVRSPGQDVNCVEIDILTLDKHPSLQGMRFAVRLWNSENECLHTVSLGDNLYRLAIQYETTVDVLRHHNDLTSNELSVGQKLVLPFCAQNTGTFAPGTEVCFGAVGRIVLIDTSAPERPIHSIETFTREGMTCGFINQGGIVALVAADSG